MVENPARPATTRLYRVVQHVSYQIFRICVFKAIFKPDKPGIQMDNKKSENFKPAWYTLRIFTYTFRANGFFRHNDVTTIKK